MGALRGKRRDGSEFKKSITKRSKNIDFVEPELLSLDLSEVVDTPNLERFRASTAHMQSVDLSPLRGCAELKELSLWLEGPGALEPLSGHPALEQVALHIRDDEAPDLRVLGTLPALTHLWLYLDGANTVDLTPLADLERLTRLTVHGKQLRGVDLSPLRQLPLSFVALEMGQVGNFAEVDLAAIARPALETLVLAFPAADTMTLYPLQNCTGLRCLNLRNNELQWIDVTAVLGLSALRRLDPPNVKNVHGPDEWEGPVLSPAMRDWLGI